MTTTNTLALGLLRWLGHQDWVEYGVRDRMIRRLCNPDVVAPHDFEVNFFGVKYKGNLSCYLDWVVYFYGAYEKYELLLLRDLVKDKARPVFIDIGANVGQHSLFMSRYCERIHAFEPYEPVRRKLEINIRRNGIRNIVVHNVGLGHEDCALDFFAPKSRNTGTGTFVSSYATDSHECMGKMRVVGGDGCVSGCGLDKLDLIKIDVEGFERNVLMGLRNTLRKYRPVVFMEFSTETKRSFQGEREMMSMLPENYLVKSIQTCRPCCKYFSRPGYRYVDFDFSVSGGNLVFVPCEEAGT